VQALKRRITSVQAAELEAAAFRVFCEQLTLPIYLVGANAEVRFANRAATAIRTSDGIDIREGYLRLTDRRLEARVREQLNQSGDEVPEDCDLRREQLNQSGDEVPEDCDLGLLNNGQAMRMRRASGQGQPVLGATRGTTSCRTGIESQYAWPRRGTSWSLFMGFAIEST